MKKMCAYTLLRSASNYEMVSYIFPAVGSQTEEHRWYVPSRADALSGATPFTLTDSESAYRSEYDGMKRPPILDRLGTLFLHTTGLVHCFTRLTRTLSLALLARPPTRWRHTHTHTHCQWYAHDISPCSWDTFSCARDTFSCARDTFSFEMLQHCCRALVICQLHLAKSANHNTFPFRT